MAWKKIEIKTTPTTQETTVDEEIANRGNVWGNIKADLQSENPVKKTMGALGVLGSPFTQVESAIANPSLAMQKGNFNPSDLGKEAMLGLTGRKQGQYGDVFRESGVPALKAMAAPAGLALSLSPLKVANTINKTFGAITKMSDKGIMLAGKSLIRAGQEAESFVGTNLNKAFQEVDSIKVDPNKFIDEVSKLPNSLLDKLEQTFGNLDDMAQNMTVGGLRKIKQTIGKYKPSIFGKEERGLAENIEADDINKVYGTIKGLLSNSISTSAGKKVATSLMKLEDSFSEVSRASDYIKRTIVDATLRKPTKGGAMAKKLSVEGDVSGRVALNTLKGAGKIARKNVNKAVSELEAFNRWRATTEFGKHVANAALFGGAVAGLGSLALKKAESAGGD